MNGPVLRLLKAHAMTDDDEITSHQDLLRKYPENRRDFEESIRRIRRLNEVRSQRPSPPPRRTLDALRKLLTDADLQRNPDKRPSPDLPIDAEISNLLDRGATYLDGR